MSDITVKATEDRKSQLDLRDPHQPVRKYFTLSLLEIILCHLQETHDHGHGSLVVALTGG